MVCTASLAVRQDACAVSVSCMTRHQHVEENSIGGSMYIHRYSTGKGVPNDDSDKSRMSSAGLGGPKEQGRQVKLGLGLVAVVVVEDRSVSVVRSKCLVLQATPVSL